MVSGVGATVYCLKLDERDTLFQQDGAMAHIARAIMIMYVERVFQNRLIANCLWHKLRHL